MVMDSMDMAAWEKTPSPRTTLSGGSSPSAPSAGSSAN